jgi:thiol-disulfide isomerase/thioredoxin
MKIDSGTVRFLVFVFGISCSVALSAQPKPVSNPVVYDTFEALEPILNRQTDTIYVINFWATWCAPCVAELPLFEQLSQQIQGKKVKILLVSIDFKRDLETKLKPFLAKRTFLTPVVSLTDSRQQLWIDKVDPNWSGAIPATLIYRNQDRKFVEGEFTSYEALENTVNEVGGQ